jgi:hypothetical protein
MNDKYTNTELAECVEEVRKQVPKGFIAYPMLAEAARRLRASEPLVVGELVAVQFKDGLRYAWRRDGFTRPTEPGTYKLIAERKS